MKTKEKHECNGKVWDGFRYYHCSRNAIYYEEEKWWCGHHAPSKLKVKREKQEKKRNEKQHLDKIAKISNKIYIINDILMEMNKKDEEITCTTRGQ